MLQDKVEPQKSAIAVVKNAFRKLRSTDVQSDAGEVLSRAR